MGIAIVSVLMFFAECVDMHLLLSKRQHLAELLVLHCRKYSGKDTLGTRLDPKNLPTEDPRAVIIRLESEKNFPAVGVMNNIGKRHDLFPALRVAVVMMPLMLCFRFFLAPLLFEKPRCSLIHVQIWNLHAEGEIQTNWELAWEPVSDSPELILRSKDEDKVLRQGEEVVIQGKPLSEWSKDSEPPTSINYLQLIVRVKGTHENEDEQRSGDAREKRALAGGSDAQSFTKDDRIAADSPNPTLPPHPHPLFGPAVRTPIGSLVERFTVRSCAVAQNAPFARPQGCELQPEPRDLPRWQDKLPGVFRAAHDPHSC